MFLNGLGSDSSFLEIGSPTNAQENPIMLPIIGPKTADFSSSFQESDLAKKKLITKKVAKPATVETRKATM